MLSPRRHTQNMAHNVNNRPSFLYKFMLYSAVSMTTVLVDFTRNTFTGPGIVPMTTRPAIAT